MRRNNEQKFYTTLDSYQSGFLVLNGHTPKLIEQGNKVVFCFDASESLYQTISEYNNGATVEAVRFALAIKNLKSQIFSLRRNKESKKDSFQQKVFQKIKLIKGVNNVITIPQMFLPFCGDFDTAAFLSQLLYWSDKGKSLDKYIFKSCKEWAGEIGLSEYKIKRCSEKLVSMGILNKIKRMAHGSNTWHYKLDRSAFMDRFIEFLKSEVKEIQKPTSNNSVSITETTTENTTEPTNNKSADAIFVNPLSFDEYLEDHSVNENVVMCVRYFLSSYKRHIGRAHPNLKPDQWAGVVDKILVVEPHDILEPAPITLEALTLTIDEYFASTFQKSCNYSIVHFNSGSIKSNLIYERVLIEGH